MQVMGLWDLYSYADKGPLYQSNPPPLPRNLAPPLKRVMLYEAHVSDITARRSQRVCTRLGSTQSKAQNLAPTLPAEEQRKNSELVLATLRTAPVHVAEFKISTRSWGVEGGTKLLGPSAILVPGIWDNRKPTLMHPVP